MKEFSSLSFNHEIFGRKFSNIKKYMTYYTDSSNSPRTPKMRARAFETTSFLWSNAKSSVEGDLIRRQNKNRQNFATIVPEIKNKMMEWLELVSFH